MGQEFSKSDITPQLGSQYDYVIVGGGTAGCILASRLSEDSSLTVALLETGGQETAYPASEVPIQTPVLTSSGACKVYSTTRQRHACRSLYGQVVPCVSGHVLGGSSTINYLMYLRGSRHDYDAWEAAGCKGWGYGDVLPYFIRAEKNTNKEYAKSGFHGTSGPITVCDSIPSPKITTALLDAARERGYPVGDLNGATHTGFSHPQLTTSCGRRVSTATAYLRPAISRPNLHVATHALARKILFNGRRACGVQYFRHNVNCEVHARREVIICAGGIESPKLLMLSGLGPRDHLEQHNIPVLEALPVGDNLQSSPCTEGAAATLAESDAPNKEKIESFTAKMEYTILGSGCLSGTGMAGYGYLKSDYQPRDDPRPYLLYILDPALFSSQEFRDGINLDADVHAALYKEVDGKPGVTFMTALSHCKSRGTVRLASSDVFDAPLVDPNFLSDPQDVRIMADGVKKAREMLETGAFLYYGAQLICSRHPACANQTYGSAAYWEKYIRHNMFSMATYCGTCKMGDADDPSSVVSPELRVHGVQGLRVADASIMPEMTSGPGYAPVVMIAEKAADIIKMSYE